MSQIFRTADVPAVQPAIYQLSIRQPGSAYAELATYTFPLTPASLRIERSALSNFSETQGPPIHQGVTRVVDTYGLSPPIFTIEGTTGWDRHLSDGYILTGLQSIRLLDKFLNRYAELNQTQRVAGNPLTYALEFYDYFTLNFWQIEPVGPQILRQSSDRPLLIYYRFRWAAIRPVGLPVFGEADAIFNTFAAPAAQAMINAVGTLNAVMLAYSPTGLAT